MTKRRLSATVLSLMVLAAMGYAAEPPSNPAKSKERFNAVAANLDTGGDLLVVANVEGYLQGLIGDISQLVMMAPATNAGPTAAKAFMGKLPDFLQRNGFYAMQGFGLSAVPRGDGLNTVKWFVNRDPAAADLPLWRAFVGAPTQTPLACTDFLPADVVLARTGNGQLKEVWKLVRTGMAELASPEINANFNRSLSNLATNMGMDLDKVFESLGGEGFLAIQLSQTATVDIPSRTGGAPTKIPQPSLLIGLAVKDDTLLNAIEAPLKRVNMPVLKNQMEATVVSSVNIPAALPFPFQPSFAVCSNFFLFGTTPQAVADAIKAFKTKNGLSASPEFRKAFEGLPATNNGIVYMSPRLMKTVADLQTASAASSSPDDGGASLMRGLLMRRGEVQSAFVIQNLKTGVLMTGTSTSGGKELAASVMLAPVGLMAAIAIPSFIKSRNTAQGNSCINNLRMIDSAKEQWALEATKKDGDETDIQGISKYIRGERLPVCPQGGTYTVNVIGKDPECSIPGHRLPQ